MVDLDDKELIKFLEDQPWPRFVKEKQLPKTAEELLEMLNKSLNKKED